MKFRAPSTFGLTHIALSVTDPARTAAFYTRVFGGRITWEDPDSIQIEGTGPADVIVFDRDPANAGRAGGVQHFGFRLKDPADLDGILNEVAPAGGSLLRRGEFSPGRPFAYVADPDGYEIEIWFE